MGVCASNVEQPNPSHVNMQKNHSSAGHTTGFKSDPITPHEHVAIQTALHASTSAHPELAHTDARWQQRENIRLAAESRANAIKAKSHHTKKFSSNYGIDEEKDANNKSIAKTANNSPVITATAHRKTSMEQEHPEWFGSSAVSTRE